MSDSDESVTVPKPMIVKTEKRPRKVVNNIKKELDKSDSDSSFDMPMPKKHIKKDPDGEGPDEKPKRSRQVKRQPVKKERLSEPEESDSSFEMPIPIKDDPDWEDDEKPRPRKNMKKGPGEKKAKPTKTSKAKKGRLPEPEQSDSDSSFEMPIPIKVDPDWEGDEEHRPQKNTKKGNGEKKTNPVKTAKAKPGGAAKTKTTLKIKSDLTGHEGDVKPKTKNESCNTKSKRKLEDAGDKPLKKIKASTSKAEPDTEATLNDDKSSIFEREADIVARNMDCHISKAKTIINMLNEGSTIPFLIRYRKNIVGDWSPSDMRTFKDLYQNAKEIVTRAQFVKKKIIAKGHFTEDMQKALDNVWTMAELDDIYEPYKPSKVPSLMSVVRDLGLDKVAHQLLNKEYVDLQQFVNTNNEHTKNLNDVKLLLATSLTDTIVRKMNDIKPLWIEDNWTMHSAKLARGKVEDDKENFKKYYDFRRPAKYVRADEILAMNRGSKKKILKLSMKPRNNIGEETRRAISDQFRLNWIPRNDVGEVLQVALDQSQDKLLKKISKKIRVDGTRSAEATAIEIETSWVAFKRLQITKLSLKFISSTEVEAINAVLQSIIYRKFVNIQESQAHYTSFLLGVM